MLGKFILQTLVKVVRYQYHTGHTETDKRHVTTDMRLVFRK